MQHPTNKIQTVIRHERSPRHTKQIPVPNSLTTRKRVIPFVLAHIILRGPRAGGKLIIDREGDGPFFLHPKKQPETVVRALLVHVAVRGQKKPLPAQVERLRINPPGGKQASALPTRQVQVHHALLTWRVELDHLDGPVLVGPFWEEGEGPLPVRGLGFEEEGFEDDTRGVVTVEVGAGEDFFQLAASHVGESDVWAHARGQDCAALVGVRVVGAGPLEGEVVNGILGGYLEIVAGKDGFDSGKGEFHYFILVPVQDSGVIGRFLRRRLQYLMQEATSNLSAAMSTSSRAVVVLAAKVLLYMKFRSSIRAFSSVSQGIEL
ncbi:RNA-binding protein AU-1, partial [Striga asiatica]